ncbi:hypothetical protein SAMN04487907_10710 [Zunongwangia mangrovi]|uniref:Uncharacterized protein n=1 Tax=Zunongwangia mangrovi TaxID=1334022 RepID=A0A1I1L1N6_9FLAO|nr:hypothetical protein SAMN04487907_10710 [Zunongwangia mangrovi]
MYHRNLERTNSILTKISGNETNIFIQKLMSKVIYDQFLIKKYSPLNAQQWTVVSIVKDMPKNLS